MLTVLLVCVLLLHAGSCQSDPHEELMAYYKAYEEAFKNQDAEAVASLYTEDCTVLFMGNLVQGRTGMVQASQLGMDAGAKRLSFKLEDIEFSADGEMGHYWGDWTAFDANGDSIDSGRVFSTISRENGELKIDNSVITGTFMLTVASKRIRDDAESAIENYEEAWKNRDAEAHAAGMTDDGICMLPGRDVVRGKEELVKAVNELLDTFDNTEVDYELEEVELITERWGYGWGYYTITDENKSVVDKGKYLSVGVIEDGKFKDHRFMTNSNMYPACAEPPAAREEL